jgi:tRNA (guanine9-N1)-methyltransferase
MEKMQKMNCDTWLGVSTTSEDYLSNPLFSIEKEPNKKQLVYLTADAEETLESLDPAEVYIIGGIVDRNRLKGITYEKAKKQGIRAAKLPIRENVSLSSSQVLTVNHVFEILVTFPQLQDWKMTFEKLIPKRKEGGKGSKDERASDGSVEGDQPVNRQESS